MELEVVWTGSTWRDYPPPQMARRIERPVVIPVPRPKNPKRTALETRAMVVSHLEAWKSVEALCFLTGRTARQVYVALDKLLAEGYAERLKQQQGRSGRYLYRRRRQ